MTTTPRTHLAAVPTLDLRDRAPLPDPDALHDCWSSASRARLGLSRQQWHHPATSDLVDALIAGEDLTDALHELGAARAAAGLSLDELLGDLAVLGSLVPRPATTPDFGIDRVDDLRAASVASTAWTETFYASVSAPNCTDTLTGLATGLFLEARLDQLIQQRRHRAEPGREHVLVVMALRCEHTSPFAVLARRIRAASELRAAFPDNDTIAVLEPTHALVVLAEAGPELESQVAAMAASAPRDRVWVEPLPEGSAEAIALVRELATIPRIPTVAPTDLVRHP